MIENAYIAYPVGIVAGFLVTLMVVGAIQAIGHRISSPEDLDFQDPEVLREYVTEATTAQLLWVTLSYLAGSFGGTLAAAWIVQENYPLLAAMIGIPMLAMGITMVRKDPGPGWFNAAIIIAFPAGAALATLLARQLFA
jgi:hypothetical protein